MRPLIICCCLLFAALAGKAGQFVGGELSYTIVYADATSIRFNVTLKIYRNCYSLADLPVPVVKVMNTTDVTHNTHPLRYYEYTFVDKTISYLDKTKLVPCVVNSPQDCYELLTYSKELDLPFSPEGYTIFYSLCCWDEGVVNFSKPGWNGGSETENQVIVPGQGLTFVATIPRQDSVARNNSPVMNGDSIISGCLQRGIEYQFHFTDADGDSLRYQLGNIYSLTTVATTSFQSVPYNTGYSGQQPMAGTPKIKLDPATGWLSGVPDKTGSFILPLLVSEYRGGNLINVHRKEFVVKVYDCRVIKPADIINCNSRLITFMNPNNAVNHFAWDFGVANTTNDTSGALLPVFTYPDYGYYRVKLSVTNPDGCTDTTGLNVQLYPPVKASFTWSAPVCNGDPLVFTDASTAAPGSISKWTWKNATRSAVIANGPVVQYPYKVPSDQIYPVSAWLIVETTQGCKDSVLKAVNIYPRVNAFAGPDTLIAFDQPYQMKGSGGNTYKWTPAIGLSNANIANPVLTINHNQRYILEVNNDGFCGGKDTVEIRYMKGPDVYVPDAFTPNNDGVNDVFRIVAVSIQVSSLTIFNRFGTAIFSTTDLQKGWDGMVNRVPQASGVYVWSVTGTDGSGNMVQRKGTFLLLR